jgi:hypothetical protein
MRKDLTKRYLFFALIITLLLYLFIRYFIIDTRVYLFFNEEDAFIPDIAKTPSNIQYYRFLPHAPGAVPIMSLFYIPFSFVFGFSYFSAKYFWIFITLIILGLRALFINRFYSGKKAVLFAALFAASPVFFTIVTLMGGTQSWGTGFFIIINLILYYWIFYGDEKSGISNASGNQKTFLICLFGLLNGISIYFSVYYLPAFLTTLLMIFAFHRKSLGFKLMYFLLFFILGLTPLFVYNHYFFISEQPMTSEFLLPQLQNNNLDNLYYFLSNPSFDFISPIHLSFENSMLNDTSYHIIPKIYLLLFFFSLFFLILQNNISYYLHRLKIIHNPAAKFEQKNILIALQTTSYLALLPLFYTKGENAQMGISLIYPFLFFSVSNLIVSVYELKSMFYINKILMSALIFVLLLSYSYDNISMIDFDGADNYDFIMDSFKKEGRGCVECSLISRVNPKDFRQLSSFIALIERNESYGNIFVLSPPQNFFVLNFSKRYNPLHIYNNQSFPEVKAFIDNPSMTISAYNLIGVGWYLGLKNDWNSTPIAYEINNLGISYQKDILKGIGFGLANINNGSSFFEEIKNYPYGMREGLIIGYYDYKLFMNSTDYMPS